MIGLVDCNSFYVSCERVFQPRLVGRPVGVLSNNDGCVIALSNELKAMGIKMGTPAFELQHLTRQGRIHLLSSNYELYGDMSARVQDVLEEFSAGVEPYSIDEMFVRFGGFAREQRLEHARQLHDRVRQYTGIPVCVGVAHTRTLAKFANRAAKKIPAYRGVCVLEAGTAETRALLQRFELGDLWGVGRRLVERLTLMGIRTGWDLAQADPKRIRRKFSVTLERTALELRGISCIEMNDFHEPRQRIMTSRSFGKLTDNLGEIREAIRQHGQRGAEKLRSQDSLVRAVLVFLKTNPFRGDLPQYNPSLVVELPRPTDDSREILAAAGQALERIYRKGYLYQKGGVMLLDLVDANRQQLSLLDTPQSQADRARSEKLMATLDELNQRMGAIPSSSVCQAQARPGTYVVRGALREVPRAGKRYPRLGQARREEARPIGRASSYTLPCYTLHEHPVRASLGRRAILARVPSSEPSWLWENMFTHTAASGFNLCYQTL